MKKALFSTGFKLAILGAALSASAVAFAAPGAAAQPHAGRMGHHACHHGHHDVHSGHPHAFMQHGKGMYKARHAEMRRVGLVVPGYGVVSRDFVDGMGLTDDQLKLIDDARKAAADLRKQHKERMVASRGDRLERFKNSIDPEQALKQAEERRAQRQAERGQIDAKWLAVWKSLDSAQQARVADHLKQRAEKAQQRAEKRAARLEERRQKREEAKAPAA